MSAMNLHPGSYSVEVLIADFHQLNFSILQRQLVCLFNATLCMFNVS